MTRTHNLPKSCHWQVGRTCQHDWSIWAVGPQNALMLVNYMVDSGFNAMTGLMNIFWQTSMTKNPMNQQNPQIPKSQGLLPFSLFTSSFPNLLRSSAPPGRCSLKGCPSSIPRWPAKKTQLVGSVIIENVHVLKVIIFDPQKTCYCQKILKREEDL